MKTLQLLLLCFIFSFGVSGNGYSQNPTYTLDVNDRAGYANFVEFDIDMTWTNSGIAPNSNNA
jgi:hypothetical protein